MTWGEPRRTVTYPAASTELAKLLGAALSGAGDLAGDARQDHLLAALVDGASDFAGGPLVTEIFNLSADVASAADVAPDLQQTHLLASVLGAGAGASVNLVQDQFFASALSAASDLVGEIEETHALAAELDVTSDLVGEIGVSFNLGAAIDATSDIAGNAQQDHALNLDIFAASDLVGELELAINLAADISATSDLAGDIESTPAGNLAEAAVVSFTGSGASQSVTGVGFQPDMIIFFGQDTSTLARRPMIADRVSLGTGKVWDASETDGIWVWFTISDSNSVTSFDADGFTVGSSNRVNPSGVVMGALCLKNGDQFEVIDKSNTGASQTVAHNLGGAPTWAICKQTNVPAGEWVSGWTTGSEAADNFGEAKSSISNAVTAVSSSDITIGTQNEWNPSSGSAPLYLFADTAAGGSFAAGTYTGSGASGKAITGLGFQPSVVLVRAVDGAGVFLLSTITAPDTALELSAPAWDATFSFDTDGFTVNSGDVNRSTEEYRYWAWS